MKIAHVNEHLARKGGVETYLLNVLPRLLEESIEPIVLYGSGDPELWPASRQVAAIGHTGFRSDSEGYKEMTVALQEEAPDIIHLHGIQNIGVIKACLDFGPTIMTTHDYRLVCPASTYFYKRTQEVCKKQCGPGCFTTTLTKHCMTPRPSFAAYYYRRSRWVMANQSRFKHLITPCADASERYQRAGFSADRISKIPYFCPATPLSEPRAAPGKTTITYVGRLAQNKGHEQFIAALGLLPENVHGQMVGNFTESSRESTMRMAADAGCDNRIELHSWSTHDEIMRLLDRTTALIFPSLWPETLGIVGLEAFSRGVPVVASRIGGVPEWLNDGVNGYMVEPGSAEQIAENVLKLISEPDRLASFGEAALRTINEKFLPARHVLNLMNVYKSVHAQ